MFDIKKTKSNELVIVLTWQTPHWLIKFRHHLLLMIVALGLSLGLSLVIFSQPAFTIANLNQLETLPTTTLTDLKIDQHQLHLTEQNNFNLLQLDSPQVCFTHFCQLGSNQPTLVFTTQNLDQVQLGHTIQAIGANNGIYEYQVTQIINAPSQQLLAQANQYPHRLVIAYPNNLWRTSLQLIIAQ